MESNYEKEMNKRNEKIPYEKGMNKRNEKIPDPQNCFGGAAINQYPQIVLGGGGEGGGDPYTNQHPTLMTIRTTYDKCQYKDALKMQRSITLHWSEYIVKTKTGRNNVSAKTLATITIPDDTLCYICRKVCRKPTHDTNKRLQGQIH